jgi:polysaccharide export outer membrane protein
MNRCARVGGAAAIALMTLGLWACATPRATPNATTVPVITSPAGPAASADAGSVASADAGSVAGADATSAAGGAAAYILAAGDELDVKIADAPQYDQTVKVRPDGKVNLSVVGSVFVAGRTPEDVQGELRERYIALAGSDSQREYLIHANDELEIKFPYYQQLNDQMRVRPDGKIQLQLVGTLQAEGRSPEELEAELQQRYARYLKEPELAVIVRSATSQTVRTAAGAGRGGLAGLQPIVVVRSFQTPQVFVTGEVARPGVVPYTPGLTLLQALAEAGGHLPSGDVTKLVILRRATPQSAQVLRPGLTSNYRTKPTLDFALQPYDVVLMPPTGAQTLAEELDRYVYKLIAPVKNSSFSYLLNGTKVY